MNHDDHEPQQTPGVPDGSGQHPRSTGRRDVPPHAKPNATSSAEDFTQRSIGAGISSEQLRNDPVLLTAVIAVLVLCGYLAFLGYVISASIIAGFDLVALASVFANGRRIEDS